MMNFVQTFLEGNLSWILCYTVLGLWVWCFKWNLEYLRFHLKLALGASALIGAAVSWMALFGEGPPESFMVLITFPIMAFLGGMLAVLPWFNPTQKRPRCPGWPRVWNLFAFILPEDIKDRVYEPARAELLRAYGSRLVYRTKWARRWINFALTVRTLFLVLNCLIVMVPDRAMRLVKFWFLGK